MNGTKITRAQLETDLNRAMDEPYVHNATEASTLSSLAVQEFYTSLSERDRKTFAEQLKSKQWLTGSELEAYLDYPATRAWGDCAVSCPPGDPSTYTACREAHSKPDNSLVSVKYARRASLIVDIKLYKQCQKVAWKADEVAWGMLVAFFISITVASFVALPMMLVTAELTGVAASGAVGFAASMCMTGTPLSGAVLNM